MEEITLSFDITSNMPDKTLDFMLNINDNIQYFTIDEAVTHVSQVFEDTLEEGKFQITLVMSGKTDSHTIFDGDTIVKSAELTINNFKFGDYKFDKLITRDATYYHNNNGYTKDVRDPFKHVLGCNGTVIYKFTTPLYMWVLENSE